MTKWRCRKSKKVAHRTGPGRFNEQKLANLNAHQHRLAGRSPGARSEKISTQSIRSRFEFPRAPELNFKLEIPDDAETKLEIETQKWKIENGQSKIGNSPAAR